MGLDMYLRGQKFFWTRWDLEGAEREAATRMEDGFKVAQLELELGYWRKHSHLHGYIVTTFAEGVDECQDIELNAEALVKTITAVEQGALPATEGFFFGNSDFNGWMEPDGVRDSVAMLRRALDWLQAAPKHEARTVIYRASW